MTDKTEKIVIDKSKKEFWEIGGMAVDPSTITHYLAQMVTPAAHTHDGEPAHQHEPFFMVVIFFGQSTVDPQTGQSTSIVLKEEYARIFLRAIHGFYPHRNLEKEFGESNA